MIHRFLLCMFLSTVVISLAASAQPAESNYSAADENWSWSFGSDEGGGGSSYLGVDIADVSAERLGALKLKEEHGAEITMVDQDAPAGKAGVHEHDVILSLNGTSIESAAQLRRMIKETPSGRVVSLGISRDGQPMTIKLQLADRHKSMSWPNVKVDVPEIPEIPSMPDFDVPVSMMIMHSPLRSGLMTENLTPQLGDFFGVKDGKGVLVCTVEKGSRGEKAGFRAGDVIVKVNNQPVRDASDFAHALRSSPSKAAAVTIMREKREQTLTLTLPEKKDSGTLLEDSFDEHEYSADMEQAMAHAGDEMARLGPDLTEQLQQQALRLQELEKSQQDRRQELQEQQQEIRDRQKEMQGREHERQQEMRERRQELRHRLPKQWAEI